MFDHIIYIDPNYVFLLTKVLSISEIIIYKLRISLCAIRINSSRSSCSRWSLRGRWWDGRGGMASVEISRFGCEEKKLSLPVVRNLDESELPKTPWHYFIFPPYWNISIYFIKKSGVVAMRFSEKSPRKNSTSSELVNPLSEYYLYHISDINVFSYLNLSFWGFIQSG